jgi:glycosyltransferase involved in cell wall biosynthesis
MRKTVLVVEWGGDWITGQELGPLELIAGLPRDRYRFHMWCNSPKVADAARERGATAEVYPDPSAEERGRLVPPAHLRSRARDVLRRIAPDLVHCNATPTVKWMLPPAHRRRVPVLYHEHNLTTVASRCWAWLHQPHLVVGVSQASVQGFLDDGMPADRVRVIYNGLDTSRLDRDGLDWPAAARSSDGLVRIGTLGSLIHRKGLDILVRAFATAHRRDPRLRLRIGGDGPQAGEVAQLVNALGVAGVVELAGQVEDLAQFFTGGVDLFVTASRAETLNRTIIEAGYCGIPVVASGLPAHLEAVGGRDHGWFTPVEDVQALADALVHAARAERERAELGARLQAHVRRRYAMARYVEEFDAAYGELLSRGPRAYGWGSLHAPPALRQWMRGAIRRRVPGLQAPPPLQDAERPARILTPVPWRNA